jgi:hypothetical protein
LGLKEMTETLDQEKDRLLNEAVKLGLIENQVFPGEGKMAKWNPEFAAYLKSRVIKRIKIDESKMAEIVMGYVTMHDKYYQEFNNWFFSTTDRKVRTTDMRRMCELLISLQVKTDEQGVDYD